MQGKIKEAKTMENRLIEITKEIQALCKNKCSVHMQVSEYTEFRPKIHILKGGKDSKYEKVIDDVEFVYTLKEEWL